MEVRTEPLSKAEKGLKVTVSLKKMERLIGEELFSSKGFSEPYVGAHRLMGRLVPGSPGIQYARLPPPHSTQTHTHTRIHAFLLFLSSSSTNPSCLQSVKIPPPLSSNLTFFSGADPGRPTLFPTACQKPAL